MKIMPINNNNNSQTHFNGRVDKKLVRLIKDDCMLGAIDDIAWVANLNYKRINVEDILKVKEKAYEILDILNNAVKNLHKDTVLKLNRVATRNFKNPRKASVRYEFELVNKKIGKDYSITVADHEENVEKKICSDCFYSSEELLDSLHKIVTNKREVFTPDKLKKQEIRIFKWYADDWDVRFPYLRARNADKLAPEFDQPVEWLRLYKAVKAQNKETIKQNKECRKQIEKYNKDIVNKLTK